MGEVYKARDTRLNRTVAIKALHDLFASHPDRVARFEREAQILASLNHANIAAIHGLEEVSGAKYLVLEFVDGRTLADVIAQGPLPCAEAVAIAQQIADALTAAHERGIIHRDLKPGNLMLTPDGQVKVLDFGLGKALEAEPGSSSSNSPTITMATQAGVVLGTAGYMSPEQAKGRPADKRSDVWAFGCVLFEMLTGRRAFEGEDITETLAAIVRGEPEWSRLPADVPPPVRVLLERCLIKDRANRLSDMSVVRFLMSDAAKTLSGAPVVIAPAPARASMRVAPLLMATAALAVIATFVLMRWWLPGTVNGGGATAAYVSVPLEDGDELGDVSLTPMSFAPDGSRVAYVGLRDGKTQVFVRALGDRTAKALEGTDGAESPFFSPTGEWIAFFSGGKLRKIAVGGTAVQPLADARNPRGGTWAADGYIYFAPTNIGGIWRVPEGGGPATQVTQKDPALGEISHRWPHLVAGTTTLLFSDWTGPGNDEQGVAMQVLGEPAHHLLVKSGNAPRYAAAPGLLLYTHLGDLVAVPWRSPQTDLGRAVPVVMPERVNNVSGNEGAGNFDLSAGGTLAYLAGGRSRNARRLVWIDRGGRIEPTPLPERDYENVMIAPDGSRAVVQIRESVTDLWMLDLSRNTLTPIGQSLGSSQSPVWSIDGTRIVYRGTRAGLRNIYWRLADGSGGEERLTTKADVSQSPTSMSPDGHWLVFNENGSQEAGGVGIWTLALEGDHTPRHFFQAPAGESDGQISPDGKWIAYQATVSSREEVYVSPFPGPGPRRQVSVDGGTEPFWSRDGHELFFQNGARLMGVTVTAGTAFSSSAPHVMHEGRFLKSINGNTGSTVTRDGARFLRIQQVEPERAVTRIDLVLNWFDEVKRVMSGGSKQP
jgi:serine/threonine-protein kinase